jgi:hypothetical protein
MQLVVLFRHLKQTAAHKSQVFVRLFATVLLIGHEVAHVLLLSK